MIAVGAALMVGPTALELSVAAVLTGFVLGILATTLGIAGTDTSGRGTISLSAQAVYDRVLSLGLLGAAVAFGVAHERVALALFGAVGLATLLVAVTTRYTVRPA
jgi:hypothetical protein